MMRAGFPDIQWTMEEMVAEADKVAARFTMRGTRSGPVFGVPPTGRAIALQAMNLYRISDGPSDLATSVAESPSPIANSACHAKSNHWMGAKPATARSYPLAPSSQSRQPHRSPARSGPAGPSRPGEGPA